MLDGQRVGIVLLSAIGDIVHALPLVASIRDAAPSASIEWIVQPLAAEITTHHPDVDHTWVLDRDRGWRGFRDFRKALGGRRFDLVLDLQFYGKASLAMLILDSPRKIGFDRRRAREYNWIVTNEHIAHRPLDHTCEQFLEFADHLGIARRYAWSLPLSETEREAQKAFFDRLDRPVATLVVGTSRREKEWAIDRWIALADRLHADFGYAIVLGGTDSRRSAEIRDRSIAPVIVDPEPDLRRLLWTLDGSAVVVSPDTGPYHAAVALDVPTIGLFGATDPTRVGPNRRYLELVVDTFHRPGEGWAPPRGGFRPERMDAIGVESVLEAVALARDRYERAVYGPGGAPVPTSVA